MSLLGVLLGVGLVACGFLLGKHVYAPKSLPVPELSEEEKTKIREERRFESLDALKAQLEQDRKSCIVG